MEAARAVIAEYDAADGGGFHVDSPAEPARVVPHP